MKKIIISFLLITSTAFSKEYLGRFIKFSTYGRVEPYAAMIYITDENVIRSIDIEYDEIDFDMSYDNYIGFYVYKEKISRLKYKYYLKPTKEKTNCNL